MTYNYTYFKSNMSGMVIRFNIKQNIGEYYHPDHKCWQIYAYSFLSALKNSFFYTKITHAEAFLEIL